MQYYKDKASGAVVEEDPHERPAEVEEIGLKYDVGKLRYDLVDVMAQKAFVEVLTFGATKYGDNNWRKVERWRDRYYAAALRHIEKHRAGEFSDVETGIPHLAHAMCCIHFMLAKEFEENGR